MQTRTSAVPDASQTSQQQSGSAPPLSEEAGDSTTPQPSQSSGPGMEKNYTDTIENLLAELWKERLVSACLLLPKISPKPSVRYAAQSIFGKNKLLSGNCSQSNGDVYFIYTFDYIQHRLA